MKQVLPNVQIRVNERLFLKDPESSKLGKKIVSGGIDLIDKIGLEEFTFAKLADTIGSTEASVYRYFENKHKMLLYLTSWYWSWTEYKLMFRIANVEKAEDRLNRAIKVITEEVKEDEQIAHINERKLHRIVVAESSKAYLTKGVDEENKEGAFTEYKQLVQRVSELITDINPQYKYPHMLISTVIEGAHHQRYFAAHLPRLTDVVAGEDAVTRCFLDLVFKTIGSK